MIRAPEASRDDMVDVERDSRSITDQTIGIHLPNLAG